ncbi:MAG: undecaprenyl-diphosphate phosphatase [Parcubacteria group bacterium]|nr:undecaprenyl-diphosphate phosphatase [Parcubacteria group bacterium]
MNILLFQAIILGLVQGLTEFLPISSSAHLVIMQEFFPIFKNSAVVFDLVLHLGSVLALLIFFLKDIKQILSSKKLIVNLILATIITVVIVFPFKSIIEKSFQNTKLAGLLLIITAIILFLASQRKNNNQEEINPKKAIVIGLGQALAVFPGISRSGTTISFGIFSGLKVKEAFQFSFLLAIPAILGASILETKNVINISPELILPSILGLLISFLVGLIALKWLFKFLSLNQRNLKYFAFYCLVVGILTMILL